jgi:hypothetical protein
MPISNVALTNTFDEWRVTTNQLIVVTNDLLGDGLTTYRSVTANVVTANTLFFGGLNLNSTFTSAFNKANGSVQTGWTTLIANGTSITPSSNVDILRIKSNGNVSIIGVNGSATTNGNIYFDLTTTGVTAATYGNSTIVPVFTVDSRGRLTSVTNTTIGIDLSSAVLKTGNTMTGTLIAPDINVTSNLRMTGGLVDIAKANIASQTLTDAATITWDGSLGQIATVTLTANRVISNVTNLKVGTYILHVIQDGTGGRTLDFQLGYRFTGNVRPTLTTIAGARDVFSFVSDGSRMYGAMIPDVG